ncbi:MAG: MotA/TolQ/ExbB proton channel family protein [Fibrobacter sp.]|nr:MotA/TolQ/ExbB proton channel family protein [Fibrobacter sp.]
MEQIISSFSPDSAGYGFMWVILFVGMAAGGIAIERFIYIILRSSKGRGEFMKNLASLLQADKTDEALNYSQASKLPLGKVIYSVLVNKDEGRAAMENGLDEAYLTEAPRINRYLNMISVVANIATLLGLLGTIYGLIYTFDAVANKPAAERPAALADGIAVAMGTTFMGLVVAIPLMFIQGVLAMQSERIIQEMEEKGLKIVNILVKE